MTYSKSIVVHHLGQLPLRVEKVVLVRLLGVLIDLVCLGGLMVARPPWTRQLQGSERIMRSQPDRSEVMPANLACFAAPFAVINSKASMTGRVMRSPSISIWRVGHARQMEDPSSYHLLVAPTVPIAIN